MTSLLILLVGAVLWGLHLRVMFWGKGSDWLGWLWFGALPAMCFGRYLYIYFYVPLPLDADVLFRPEDVTPWIPIILGSLEWIAFVVLEPVLLIVKHFWFKKGR